MHDILWVCWREEKTELSYFHSIRNISREPRDEYSICILLEEFEATVRAQ